MSRFLADSRPQCDPAFHSVSNFYREEFVKCKRCLEQQREYYSEDAITDVDAASHTHAFTKIFPHLGEIATTQQIIDTLEGRSVGLEASPAVGGPITRTSRRSENAGI